MRTYLSRIALRSLTCRLFSSSPSKPALLQMNVSDGSASSIIENGAGTPRSDVLNSSIGPSRQITSVVPVDARDIGKVVSTRKPWIQDWSLELSNSASASAVRAAARLICETNVPVAFPTETVYGLGADATRDDAVRAIYKAKGRPSDNPLIVHFASIKQIREFFASDTSHEPIPSIYESVIESFWPGPLTILLPLPPKSRLAPSVTVGLPTVGVRVPRSPIALALISLTDTPIAAPSANASTRPSPTAAEHVAHDLNGHISTVLDGGPCDVGVESTVVDGLSSPPAILRPGGISIEQLRACKGWESVVTAYSDHASNAAAPRAPGMKYKHYSPKAQVVLHRHGDTLTRRDLRKAQGSVGILLMGTWKESPLFASLANGVAVNGHNLPNKLVKQSEQPASRNAVEDSHSTLASLLSHNKAVPTAEHFELSATAEEPSLKAWVINLGTDTKDIARGLFAALRELDLKGVDTIFIEGLDEADGDLAVAVMNRLRKAAEVHVP